MTQDLRRALIIFFITIVLLFVVEGASYLFLKDKVAIKSTIYPVLNIKSLYQGKNAVREYYKKITDQYFAYDATLGFRFKPNKKLIALEGDEAGYPQLATSLQLTTDNYGFISNDNGYDNDYAIDSNIYTILITGGSTSSGWGATENHYTWISQLERLLNENKNTISQNFKRVRVINSGVFGYRAAQELKRFQEETIYLKPDLVIMFNGINEPWTFKGNPVDYSTHSKQYMMMNHFNQYSSIKDPFSLVMPYTMKFIDQLDKKNSDLKSLYGYKKTPYLSMPAAELYMSKIKQFDAICRSHGIDFLYYLQPIMGAGKKVLSKREESLKNFFESVYYRNAWGKYSSQMNTFYNQIENHPDMLAGSEFKSARMLFDSFSDTLYSDPRHYNNEGQRVIAEYIYKEVLQHHQDKLSGKR